MCGAPGVLAAAMVLRLKNPLPGVNDQEDVRTCTCTWKE